MPRARIKHVLVCIICLKRVESEKEANNQESCRTGTPGPGGKDDPLLIDDLSSGQEEEKSLDESDKTNLYRKFLQFINQYFKLRAFTDKFIACAKDAKSEDGSPEELETFCESCGDLVSEICGLYKQLKSAELLLVWRLGQVGQLMKKSKSPMTYKLKKELWTLMARQINLNVATRVNLFRRTLKVKCTHAAMASLPDVTVHRGLFPDEWKFTYAATKKTLIRLIVVFILGSSQFRSKPIQPSIDATAVNINDKVFSNQKPCPKSKKKVNLKPIAVKIEPGPGNDTAFTEDVDDENGMPDNLGNDSDSDWSRGAIAASPMSACSDLPSDGHETSIKTRRRTLRNRRNIVVKAEEDGDTTSGSDDDAIDKRAAIPRKVRGRPRLSPNPSKSIKSTERKEKCPQCPLFLKDRAGLVKHLRCTHHTDVYYDCETCGMRFKRKTLLILHFRKVHGWTFSKGTPRGKSRPGPRPLPTPCPKCSVMFPNRIEMHIHHKKFHRKRSTRHECPYCFKKIFHEKTYNLHLENHEQKSMLEEVDIWYCEVCCRQFYKEENLKSHMKDSHQDKYTCTVCNENLDTGKLLREHLISHETKDDKPFKCHICLKGFSTKQFCEIHRKLGHMYKWKLVCDFGPCSDIFDTIPEFNEHLKSHLDDDDHDLNDEDKPIKILFCKTCDLGFLKEYSLTLHKLAHTPENEIGTGYDCPKCDKVLRSRETLFAHFNYMHGQKTKPFLCRVCGKQLSNARWFRSHIRLHEERLSTGKFICDICGIRCVDSIGLSAHRQNHNYNPEKSDVGVEEDLMKGRKRMKLIWRQTEMDLLMDPASPLPPEKTKKIVKKKKGRPRQRPMTQDDLERERERQERERERQERERQERFTKLSLSCDVENCGLVFESAYLLRKHLESEHELKKLENEKNIPCYYCYQRFCYSQSREIHVRAEHKKKIYGKFKCDSETCEEEPFISVEELNEHLKTHLEPHSGEGGIKEISICGICTWGFVKPELRDLHRLSHIPPDSFGRFQCPFCSDTFNENFLRAHYRKVHGPQLLQHRCEICDKVCISKDSLNHHKKGHKRKRQWPQRNRDNQLKCFICDVLFEDNALLMAHVKEYHPANYHTCEVAGCGAGFSNIKYLWNHIKSRHKSRNFICDLCGMAFYTQYHLTGHMAVHRPKNIPCDLCGKLFRREKNVERHKAAVHNSERSQDFVCSACGKGFFAQVGLTYHFDSCHKPQSEWHLKCPKCPRRFYRNTLMDLHTKKCDGSWTMNDEENNGDGGAVDFNRKRGQPRKGGGGRQKKKKVESDEEEEEMEEKSTTEDEEEEERKPSTSSSSAHAQRNEFQDMLSSSAYLAQMWSGQAGIPPPPTQAVLQGPPDGLVNFPTMPFNQQQLQRRQDM